MEIEYKGYSNDESVINRIKKEGCPVVIGGTGSVGQAVAIKLHKHGITDFINCPVSVDQDNKRAVLESECPYESYFFILGYLTAYSCDLDMFKKLPGCIDVLYFSELYDAEVISYDFYSKHKNEFEATLNILADEKSVSSMKAFLEAKINEDTIGLAKIVEKPQYFGASFVKRHNDEVFVDCGAYDGDTIRAFIDWCGGNYKRIIAFEPEPDNICKLKKYLADNDIPNVCIQEFGVYSEKTELHFYTESEMSRISGNGDITINTETIDNVVGRDDVTFIKMDIEGSELQALKGAEKTIKRCHPTLAISAYHKKDDLIALTNYIRQCWDEYKLYFRCHKELPIDAVLYAIP